MSNLLDFDQVQNFVLGREPKELAGGPAFRVLCEGWGLKALAVIGNCASSARGSGSRVTPHWRAGL